MKIDTFIQRNESLVKNSIIKNTPFQGCVDYPVYFELSELPPDYNKPGIIYIYNPVNTNSDNNGILSYEVIGMTMKKSDKKVLFIVNDLNHNPLFKRLYIELKPSIAFVPSIALMSGNVYDQTFDNYKQAAINSEYKGSRNSNWIKLDHNDYLYLSGMVYTSGEFKNIS